MHITPPYTHQRRRLAGAALTVVAAIALTVGTATSSAATKHGSGSRTGMVVSSSPANPQEGQPFTLTFKLVKGGVDLPIANPDCLGMTNGRPIPPSKKTNNGTVATCTWDIPEQHGKTFDGMLVVFNEAGVEYFAGFDLAIH